MQVEFGVRENRVEGDQNAAADCGGIRKLIDIFKFLRFCGTGSKATSGSDVKHKRAIYFAGLKEGA